MDIDNLKNIAAENSVELISNNSIRFNRLKQQYLKKVNLKDINYIELLKAGSQFFTYNLPLEISELFIRKEDTPTLWLLEFPLIIKCEQALNVKSRNRRNQDENSVKKYYQRWVVAKETYQKQIFSSLIVKQITNLSVSNNFLDLFYFSLVLIYDDNIRNFNEAIQQLQKAKNLLNDSSMDESLKEEVSYYIELYRAFSYMELGNYEEASKCLMLALEHSQFGITAKFYLAYIYAITGQNDAGELIMKEIFNYDIQRLDYAADQSNNSLFNYFLNNNVFINIFYYSEFSVYFHFIEQLLLTNAASISHLLEELKKKLDALNNAQLNSYYTKEFINSLSFISKLIEDYKTNSSPVLIIISQSIYERFKALLDELQRLVKQKNYMTYESEMKKYDGYIEDNKSLLDEMSKDLNHFKEEIKKKLSSTIQQIEDYTRESIQDVENALQKLDMQSSFNPIIAFRNSMSYNLFLSIIVFIIGGVAGYFNNSGYFEGEFNFLISKIIVTGVKWSALTFVIGFFVSSALAGFVVVERSNKRQKFRRIVIIHKKEKDIAVNALKKEAERKQTSISENFNERIESQTRKIEELKFQKEDRRKILEAEAEKICRPILEKLAVIYPS